MVYAGPHMNFNMVKTRPIDLGYEKLTFITFNDEEYTFDSNDVIDFKQ
jgi:hypothetical protein